MAGDCVTFEGSTLIAASSVGVEKKKRTMTRGVLMMSERNARVGGEMCRFDHSHSRSSGARVPLPHRLLLLLLLLLLPPPPTQMVLMSWSAYLGFRV